DPGSARATTSIGGFITLDQDATRAATGTSKATAEGVSDYAHEYFHRMQFGAVRSAQKALSDQMGKPVFIPAMRDRNFMEGTAAAMERHICVLAKDFAVANLFEPTHCLSAGTLGGDANASWWNHDLLNPRGNHLDSPYESLIFWRYFIEQFSLPLATGGLAR